jgi:hypothetical protein
LENVKFSAGAWLESLYFARKQINDLGRKNSRSVKLEKGL